MFPLPHKYRKIGITFLIAGFLNTNAFAQLKIGPGPTIVNPSAMLQVDAATAGTRAGLLLPRVALSATTTAAPCASHVAGMTVYNTATAADVSPGYYYNDGTKWVAIAAATAEPWYKTGTTTGATANTDNMYAMGQIIIGSSTVPAGGTNARLIVNNGTTNGALQLKDGTEGAAKLLTSDANGLATWQKYILPVTNYISTQGQDLYPANTFYPANAGSQLVYRAVAPATGLYSITASCNSYNATSNKTGTIAYLMLAGSVVPLGFQVYASPTPNLTGTGTLTTVTINDVCYLPAGMDIKVFSTIVDGDGTTLKHYWGGGIKLTLIAQ